MRIGVLTSGGDAPGMNACIRVVVRRAIERGSEVVGIERGYAGLPEGSLRPLDRRSVVNVIHRGGTILGTARSDRFRHAEGRAEAGETLRAAGVDAVVLIGGDGTFRGAELWESEGGPPTIGVPGTIDNDVGGTDRSIGADTAVNTAVEAIDRIRDTAASHELLHFVEVMGRHCGWLALAAGVAGGAEAALIPESPAQVSELVEGIGASLQAGKRSVIVVVSEGVEGGVREVAERVGRGLRQDYRVTVLGHIQRGGTPTAEDRILGSVLGAAAADALLDGARGHMVGRVRGETVRTKYAETGRPPALDPVLLALLS